MADFFQAISGVIIIVVLIAVGYALAGRGWFDQKSTKLIAKLVTQVALPCYMVVNMTSDFSANELLTMLPDLRFPVLSMLILMAVSYIIIRVVHVNEHHQGLFASMFFNSNTVFVGLPINMALFGEKAVPYVLIYYMANTTIFWTLGSYLIQRDGPQTAQFSLKTTLGKIFSPPLLGFILGVILVLLHVKLPTFVASDLRYLGNLTVPLSMLFIGIVINNAGLSSLRLGKDNLLILLGRFILAPTVMSLLVLPTHLPLLMKQVFILQSSMPVMTNAPVLAKLYNADEEYAAVMVTETTLMSLIVVPILMVLV